MSFLAEELTRLEAQNLRRQLRTRSGKAGRTLALDGQELINFSSNNYLGLACHPQLIAAAQTGAAAGTGSTASRLVTGNLVAHEALEASLAAFHQSQAARLFNSGYQANLGLLSAIAGKDDLIVSDALNHASLIDGCRLSRATIRVAKHADSEHVRTLLRDSASYRRRFVVTDSVFSMDGDLAPVGALRSLCDEFDAFLIVDEAHAVGVLGPEGRGICAQAGVSPDALVAGLGKGFGGFGGYVVGSRDLCEVLLNRSRSFVFSTALPPAVVAAAQAAVHILVSEEGRELRGRLARGIDQLRAGLKELGRLTPGAGRSPIFPLLANDAATALQWTEYLIAEGFFCQAIRPPTVAPGSSRLRIAVSALHTEEDLAGLLRALRSLPG